MNPEMRQFIHEARYCRASVQRVAEMLPSEDAELDALLAETVRENNPKAFAHVVVAALARERRVEARHLAQGATLLGDGLLLGSAMMKAQGDVPEQVMAAMENTLLAHQVEAAALLAMQEWCREHRGGKLPENFFLLARRLARNNNLPNDARALVITLARRTNDAGLVALFRGWYPKAKPERIAEVEALGEKAGGEFLQNCRRPILEILREKTDNALAHGVTMRRAVARTGRNEPCPCGSGKKYKHCCLEKDNERLHHSSDVAGVTAEELQGSLDTHLTAALMDRIKPHELLLLDPLKIPADLLDDYFLRLAVCNLFDRALEAFEKIGFAQKAMLDNWLNVMFFAVRAGRKEVAQRLMKVREQSTKELEQEISIPLGAALLLENDNPARVLQIMDETAREVLASEDPEQLRQMVTGLLFSPQRALGILAARGAIPLLPSKEAVGVLDRILEARDILNLPPDDPISDLVDKRHAEHEEDDAKLRSARQSLDAKAEEVRRLKEQLDGLQAEIIRREKKHAADAAENAPMKELRRKVEELKSALTERHQEKNQLRRDLQKAQEELASAQKTQPAQSADEEAESARREDELLLPQDAPEIHPVRLAEYPKGFLQTLSTFPQHVARAAVIMVGRLSAGDPAAFAGALRLKATPKVMRQRIGINYRLLFRLWPERLEVIDLINRKDLDRRLKTLV